MTNAKHFEFIDTMVLKKPANMDDNKKLSSAESMARLLQVSKSGYNRWKKIQKPKLKSPMPKLIISGGWTRWSVKLCKPLTRPMVPQM
ncbi:hypothetical protein D9B51_02410 [Corynebacterium diphtheriae]|nr:hypothetical protein D9B51_02410 [Corynebacterium diphtheriae]